MNRSKGIVLSVFSLVFPLAMLWHISAAIVPESSWLTVFYLGCFGLWFSMALLVYAVAASQVYLWWQTDIKKSPSKAWWRFK